MKNQSGTGKFYEYQVSAEDLRRITSVDDLPLNKTFETAKLHKFSNEFFEIKIILNNDSGKTWS